jgi:alanyl-tRNA synthetase
MTSAEIRRRFLKFFEGQGHRVVPSSSLVPANDPTLLFTNAGMNQFKDVFLGRERREYLRACSAQKCVRAGGKHNDLEQVGRTTRHNTFFEMLGNFSFGDYFKKEAIPWAWELVTKDFALPISKLYVTVFREDDEAAEIWAKDVGVPRERIFRFDEKDNFWAMGETGPCGPCSEIHYDLGPAASDLGHKDCALGCDCGRYVELWNLVFMQFNRDEQGKMTSLPRPSIDTGAGLERLATVLQGKVSNFDTDLFQPLIAEAASLANVEYGAGHDTDVSLRIIADHSRAATFLISDGVLPSNEGHGYVLRLILRRALYHGQTLGLNEPFMFKLSGTVVDMMKGAYPELVETAQHVAKVINLEEERYAHTTRVGLERLENTPIVLDTGEEVPFRLARLLPRVIGNREPGENLASTYECRRASYKTNQQEDRAFQEFQKLWDPRARLVNLPDTILATLPRQVRQHDWVGDFRVKCNQAASLLPWDNYRERVQKVRDSVADNPLLRDSLDLLLRKFPPADVSAWVPGDELFRLHDTFGLRPEFVLDIVKTYGFSVDWQGYQAQMAQQRERARASWKAVGVGPVPSVYLAVAASLGSRPKFVGYESTESPDCRVLALEIEGKSVDHVAPGSEVEIVLDHTPFYAEAGGQVGDTGSLFAPNSDHELAHITDTYYPVSGLIVHKGVARDSLRVGDLVTARVDAERRNSIRRNHTATHLLHAALRQTLGTHVKQAGSLVAPDRLRFDFTHFAALDEQDLLDIEDLVNRHVLANEAVETNVMDLDAAVNSGAMALFGEKYAERVRVVSINDFSKELCGGTHVRRTGDIGLFKVVSEGSVAAGTRRIEALTGEGLLEFLRRLSLTLAQVSDTLRAKPDELLAAAEKLAETEKKLRKELESLEARRAASQAGGLVDQARDVKGVRVISARVDASDRSVVRQMVDDLRAKLQSGVIVLGSVADGKVALIAAVTKDLTGKLDAGQIVRQAAAFVEGSGGGKKDLAEAGGRNPSRLDESLRAVPGIIEKML